MCPSNAKFRINLQFFKIVLPSLLTYTTLPYSAKFSINSEFSKETKESWWVKAMPPLIA